MRHNPLLQIFILVLGIINVRSADLETVYEWKYLKISPVPLKYRVESRISNRMAIISNISNYNATEFFNYQNAVPFDVDISSDGRVFITVVPRSDVKVSLLTVSGNVEDNGPMLEPYPDHSWYTSRTDCRKIISSWSITIDACNRLWVLDNGRVDNVKVCPAKLMAFDLKNNTLIRTYDIPDALYLYTNYSALINPLIHTNKLQCDEFTAFFSDSENSGLAVLNDKRKMRHLRAPAYSARAKHMNISIAGESFSLPAGIVPMDLDPAGKHLFFAPLASRGLFAQNAESFAKGDMPVVTGVDDIFEAQATAFRWSNKDILFVGLANNEIICWNRKHQLCEDDFDMVVKDYEKLQYITALKIVPEESSASGEEELIVMSNRLQKTMRQTRNFHEINFRIMKNTVRNLIKDTACEGIVCEECYGTIYGTIME